MKKETVIKKPATKFIDKLHNILVTSGFDINREGWSDYYFDKNGKKSETENDPCEWIDILLKEENGQRHIVQFYFSKNASKLAHVHVYVQKRKRGWKPEKLISSSEQKIGKVEKSTPTTQPIEQYRYA